MEQLNLEDKIKEYTPLIKSRILAFKSKTKEYSKDLSYQDLYQISYIILDRALQKFDKNRNVKFTSYYCCLLNREFYRELQKKTKKAKKEKIRQSVNIEQQNLPSQFTKFHEIDNRDNIERIFRIMNESEKEILIRRFWYGDTLQEIGKRFNLSSERIRQKINEALEKARLEFGENSVL